MATKAIFLDWDGTLINSFERNFCAINETLAHYNKAPISEEFYAHSYGLSSREIFTIMFQEELNAIASPEEKERYLNEVRGHYYAVKERMEETEPAKKLDGADAVMATLKALKEDPKNNLFIGIISNKKQEGLLRELEKSGWKDIVDVAVGKTPDHGGKPGSGPLNIALNAYPSEPKPLGREMLYIGDTDVDCDFARNHNMQFIGVGSGVTRYLEPGERVGGLEQLNDRLKALTIAKAPSQGQGPAG